MSEAHRHPFGIAYQNRCAQAAIQAGCKGNTMGVLYCLFMQSGLWDWTTGQTMREISHKDIAKAMGGVDYKVVQRATTALRAAGVLGYAASRGRGVKWADGTGKANRYQLLLPAADPSPKKGRPLPQKGADPFPKKGQHYHSSIYSNGERDAPRGERGGRARRAEPRPMLRGETYSDAVYRWKVEDEEALRAAENEGGEKIHA